MVDILLVGAGLLDVEAEGEVAHAAADTSPMASVSLNMETDRVIGTID
jgi:hypothetical protein